MTREKIPLVSKIVNDATGGLNNPDTGIMFCTNVTYMEGFEKQCNLMFFAILQ
ncbi:MAG: hypothetical protein L6V93_05480 [Clostridiales bacterium]|nr:MAG: hypothetical protein L6V93_05480 [Clostridiales bacterium]